MTTAIIGMGNIGSRLAADLAKGGEQLLIASRDPADARRVAEGLGDGVTAVSVDEAVDRADVLVLTVWFDVIKQLLDAWGARLNGKIVVDPSNPIAPAADGSFTKTIPQDQSSGGVLAAQLPDGARLVKAFGTFMAETLGAAAHRNPRAVAFYAADDRAAGDTVAGLIRTAGFDPVSVGGIDQSIRIEVFGDLHEGSLGTTLTAEEATARV
ncbi:NADPH-dependent F420 reductase [Streptomyces yaizuensis]|uniref:NAD(P)-binding domain-containing protein n=1 Tax=Streptomyces yaizuensis TaxID=2989713 RepID=A0ABQ5P955_9ACTN|nr:NAD(P)-binding domain-containing protein [Streptomyces sp. YSPA8]GLF99101.1 NAD(P)-binding domain-containing protein [Streptomyces sp. YSPA8]